MHGLSRHGNASETDDDDDDDDDKDGNSDTSNDADDHDNDNNDNDRDESIVSPAEWQQIGNRLFKEDDLNEACHAYTNALAGLVAEHATMDISIMVAVLCNRSAARVKLYRAEDAVDDAADAVRLDPSQVKPHYRLATALRAMGRHREAMDACDAGLELSPGHEQLVKLRASCSLPVELQKTATPEAASIVKCQACDLALWFCVCAKGVGSHSQACGSCVLPADI